MDENIWIEFDCPYCEQVLSLPYCHFKGIFEVHHYYCTNCHLGFKYKFDQDMIIEYIGVEK